MRSRAALQAAFLQNLPAAGFHRRRQVRLKLDQVRLQSAFGPTVQLFRHILVNKWQEFTRC